MTAAERRLWQSVHRRAAQLSPELGAAILRAFASVRDSMTESQIERAITLGGTERLFEQVLTQAVLTVAFQPTRERLRRSVAESVRYTARTLPVRGATGPVLTVGFDLLNPRVITAVRTLESRVIGDLSTGIRETIRAYVEQGLREGLAPRAIARDLRWYVGVPPSREVWIQNYAAALREATTSTKALGYELRDKRFDATIAAARRSGTPLTDAQVEKMTSAMRRKTIAFSAETVSRTATLDALKLGQRLSWEAAAEQGVVERDRIMRRWAGVMDDRERLEHVKMEGDVAPLDLPHRNGQMIPGESEYNCRCIDVYFVASAA